MAKNSIHRLGRDIVKGDNWNASLGEIQKRESSFCQVYDIWKNTRDQEICEAVYQQHHKKLKALGSISCKSIKETQKEGSRIALLEWLSSTDPSENYNSALQTREDGTGDWLLRENED